MKTAKEKAEDWLKDHFDYWGVVELHSLTKLLKEQDRDTRHACAEAVISCREVCETPNGNSSISPDDAHLAVMNTKVV